MLPKYMHLKIKDVVEIMILTCNFCCFFPKGKGIRSLVLSSEYKALVTNVELGYHYNTLYLSSYPLSSSEQHPLLVYFFFSSRKALLSCSRVEILIFIICRTQNIFPQVVCFHLHKHQPQKIIKFLEHYSCLKFEQQKITKRLIFTHIKYSFFSFSNAK